MQNMFLNQITANETLAKYVTELIKKSIRKLTFGV